MKTYDKQVARFAGFMTIATAISRVTGLIRDILKAQYFGTGIAADAFTVAFRLPNLLRHLLGEGTLSAAFIPVYTSYRIKLSAEESWHLVNAVFTLATMVLAVVTLLGIIFAKPLVIIFVPGFSAIPGKIELTIKLTQWLFPYIIFVGLAALAMAILNTNKRFFLPALAPIVLNLAMIVSMIYLCRKVGETAEEQIFGLAIGTLIGGFGQFAIQWPALRHVGYHYKFSFDWKNPGVRRILKLMGPGVFALAVTQINMFVDTFLASLLAEGSVAALEYANRLTQLPLGVFAVSITTAILPVLSEQATLKNYDQLKDTLAYALKLIFFVLLPSTVGIIVLKDPLILLIYQRGAFDQTSTSLTVTALVYYVVGLTAYGGVKAVAQAFFALQDTKTPVKIAAVALVANIILNLLFIKPLKIGGLALATSLSAIINISVLFYLLQKRIGSFKNTQLLPGLIKIAASSLAMGVTVMIYYLICIKWYHLNSLTNRLFISFSGIMFGCASYTFFCWLFKVRELQDFCLILKRKIKR